MIAKTLQLISLIPSRPAEFVDHVSAVVFSRLEKWRNRQEKYQTTRLEDAIRILPANLNSRFVKSLEETALAEVEEQVSEELKALYKNGPFASFHNGDGVLARICYAATRALQPGLVIETGVCYGVTSAFILKAMQANQHGRLHSVDLPPLGKDADKFVGRLIPQELRSRWSLHRGVSRRILSPLLRKLGPVDLFVHDSFHSYRNMKMEFNAAWPRLVPGGVLISDDVEGNSAFQELAARSDVAKSIVVEESGKKALLGVAVKCK